MNEATDPTEDNRTSSPNTCSAFNMRVINDEDSEHHLFIAETGSTNGSNSLLLTSDILNQQRVKICSQVPHLKQHIQPSDIEDEPHYNDKKDQRLESVKIASKSSTSGARNKRKNFQPRSIFIVDDNEEENHFENNSNDDTNDDLSGNESDQLINGKSSSDASSYASSVCDSSEVQLQESSHPQSIVTSLTSITGNRRSALLQRSNQSTLQQSQPLDLSNQENDTKTNGLITETDNKSQTNIDLKVNDKSILNQSQSGVPSGPTNPMDLSTKRSGSDDDLNEDADESVDEDVVDLRLSQLMGQFYNFKQGRALPSEHRRQMPTTTADNIEDSEDSDDSNGTQTNASLNRINFGDKTNTNNESESKLFQSLRNRVYDSMPSSLQTLFSSPNNRYSNEQSGPQNMSSLLSFAALGKSFRKESNSSGNNSWKKSSTVTNLGPAPWIDKSFLTPSSSSNFGGLTSNDSLAKSGGPVDYTRYVKRYINAADCNFAMCRQNNYREHFHCLDCNSRVFVKKEEMIRHFKWHKKRDESLIHGFMRYSPCDDCSDKFPNCSHNRKQTHYHCLKLGCDKTYISTSDVQMHANYHRKDTAIIQEGFQRFRSTEDCLLESCAFHGQKTTHFHCRRDNCNHTFKNKADMEKHKSYHIKDEQLNRDGFKKFMKHELCSFESCRFSRVCNHIHCIRPGCTYVLHSSGQLYSHKRKHERRENELAYRKFRLAQNMLRSINGEHSLGLAFPFLENSNMGGDDDSNRSSNAMTEAEAMASQLPLTQIGAIPLEEIIGEIPESKCLQMFNKFSSGEQCLSDECTLKSKEHNHCKVCPFYTSDLDDLLEHAKNHVTQDEATPLIFEESDDASVCTKECEYFQKERHYHCRMYGCACAILLSDTSFKKLNHYKMHEHQQRINAENELQSAASQSPPPQSHSQHFLDNQLIQPFTQTYPTGTSITSIDGLPILKRKRGRPPKNRVIEMPQSIYSSFKFNKSEVSPQLSMPLALSSFGLAALYGNSNLPLSATSALSEMIPGSDDTKTIPIPFIFANTKSNIQEGFIAFDEGFPCTDKLCKYFCQMHYHCCKPRCYYVTNRSEILVMHSKDFHENMDIMEGFVYYDSAVDCRVPGCANNKTNRHYHCTRNGCNFSFVRYTQMSQHEQKHKLDNSVLLANPICDQPLIGTKTSASASQASSHSDDETDSMKSPSNNCGTNSVNNFNNRMQTVKAKGTYYPLSSLSQRNFCQSLTSTTKTDDESDSEDIDEDCDSDVLSEREPLQPLLQEHSVFNFNTQNNNQWVPLQHQHQQYSPSNGCGRPFCKLKKRDHFHCNICNQAFSSFSCLVPHWSKQHSTAPKPTAVYLSGRSPSPPNRNNDEIDSDEEEEELEMSLANLSTQMPHSSPNLFNFMNNWVNTSAPSSTSLSNSLPNISTPMASTSSLFSLSHTSANISSINSILSSNSKMDLLDGQCLKRRNSGEEMTSEMAKRLKLNNNNIKMSRDEPVPTGYLRFRFNEDCRYEHCGYREHQTHFHCMRKDCGYSFCDKTRFVQHTARHERLDTLMGGDFHQFRSNVNCGRTDCQYANIAASTANKASHFHCIKCDFVCTDTNKVVAHRRQHAKMDNITAAGFEKYSPTQDCRNDNCNYNQKQTHYHCLKCQYSVLGLSQMSSHKYKHSE